LLSANRQSQRNEGRRVAAPRCAANGGSEIPVEQKIEVF
jgi:hypothetical protein